MTRTSKNSDIQYPVVVNQLLVNGRYQEFGSLFVIPAWSSFNLLNLDGSEYLEHPVVLEDPEKQRKQRNSARNVRCDGYNHVGPAARSEAGETP
ncbi:hypothetical protein OsI_18503 [Oryza sativa Indica Group]|uniref:Uncharacterized protein n=1 Tax=Oryza sativa subsp. indica TaxID=39946 RepID=B8AY61_ORYSI|nr:hypothetical protein OsI_18503 [Oryza sativa Indica Group]